MYCESYERLLFSFGSPKIQEFCTSSGRGRSSSFWQFSSSIYGSSSGQEGTTAEQSLRGTNGYPATTATYKTRPRSSYKRDGVLLESWQQ